MIAIKDTKDNWAWLSSINSDWICFEDGERRKWGLGDLVFERGKYEGTDVSEVDDEWYWKFLQKKAKEDEDVWLQYVIDLRNKELG